MLLLRAMLMPIHAALYQLASTPPNKSPEEGRYDAAEPVFIKVAPLIFKIQQPVIWFCTLVEVLLTLSHLLTPPLSAFTYALCPAPSTAPRLTPALAVGLTLLATGTALRLACYRTLGPLFTFDLALLPAHRLVTSGPYATVRHPAYAGSLLVLAGVALVNLGPGSWLATCALAGHTVWGPFALWYGWWFAVGVRRARAEDDALHRQFGADWERYAAAVRAWFVPGLL